MTDDIVARLRVLNHHAKKLAENESLHDLYRDAFTRCEDLTSEAAAEIKRLRDLIEGYHLTAMGQRAEIKRLRELSGDAGCLRAERDEARWRLCKVVGDNRGVWGCEIAKENGWDYLATEAKP